MHTNRKGITVPPLHVASTSSQKTAKPHSHEHATIAVLALKVALNQDRRVPSSLTHAEARRRLTEIHTELAESAWRQLRSRFFTVPRVSRELQSATVQATAWVDEFLPAAEGDVYCLARTTVISAVTRRLVIDGQTHAKRLLASIRRSVAAHPVSGGQPRTA